MKEGMGKNRTDIGTTLGIVLLSSVTVGAIYWTTVFASEQDTAYTHAVSVIDEFMLRAYGIETSRAQ